jgi:hypothetical protein
LAKRIIDKIREAVRTGNYDMTHHANEEMAEDNLAIYDIEYAILNGRIVKREKDDPRGTKYTVFGKGMSPETSVGIVGRFKETGVFLIITVYKVE